MISFMRLLVGTLLTASICFPEIWIGLLPYAIIPKWLLLVRLGWIIIGIRPQKMLQQRVFREQIRLARQKKKPIVIHNRDAHEDVVRILKEEDAKDVGGVMHCYSGSWETAKRCLDMNFYISFGGPVTFKNARVPKEVLANVPLDRLLIETDAPYLAPHPHRGKRNESAFVRLVAETAAEITGRSVDEIAKITTENAMKCFGIR